MNYQEQKKLRKIGTEIRLDCTWLKELAEDLDSENLDRTKAKELLTAAKNDLEKAIKLLND